MDERLASNLITVSDLRTGIEVANHFASVIYVLGPLRAGMRNAVDRLPGHVDVGWIIDRIFSSALDTVPGLMAAALSAVDSPTR
eukprot:16438093-Heterocapsa_arctica.AAC.1